MVMKRIAFAHIEFVIDFDSYEEALKYVRDNQGKGWHFEEQQSNDMIYIPSFLDDEQAWNKWYDRYIYPQDENWIVVVRKPYRDYNPGW